jgi:hypothetical protein
VADGLEHVAGEEIRITRPSRIPFEKRYGHLSLATAFGASSVVPLSGFPPPASLTQQAWCSPKVVVERHPFGEEFEHIAAALGIRGRTRFSGFRA